MHGSRHPGSSQEPDQPSRISSAPNMYCAPIMYQHFTPVPGTQLALVISGHPIHKSWSAIGHLKLFFIMSAFGYEKRARQDPRGSAYVFCHGSLRHAGRWFPEERASHHLGFLVWDGLQCPHCWLSRPPLVFCGLPSSEFRVKTETQPKCQVLFCFKFSQGWAEVFQFHHKHLQGLHTLAGPDLQIGQLLQTQNVAEFQRSWKGEFLGGPGNTNSTLVHHHAMFKPQYSQGWLGFWFQNEIFTRPKSQPTLI